MNNSTANIITKDINGLELCMGIGVLLGLPIQSYATWLIVKGTGNEITMEFFLLNSLICEIFSCIDGLLFLLAKWWLCFYMLALFLQGLLFAGRPLFQCLICVERYLAVVHPVTFLKYKPLRYRLMCSAVAWLLVLVSCVLYFFSSITFNATAHEWYFLILYLMLLPIQLFCCVAVLRALKQSGPGERGREREEENNKKRRAFYLILITTVNMIFMYIPFIINAFFTIVTQGYVPAIWVTSSVFYGLGGYLQPLLYLRICGKISFCALS